MLNTKFSPWPSFTEEESNAVQKVLLSNKVNYWTGTECKAFEKEFAKWSNVKHAIALANGTLALELALRAFDIGEGDEVIVTPKTFIASVSCVINVGAKPVFADVDLNSQAITAETIKLVLTENTKAVIVVHLSGMPAEMDPIMDLSNKFGFKVIEDCAQAHGAMYKGKSVGSIGHIGAWSFCQDKIMSTGGEGGMVTTNDASLWSKMWDFKDHGKSYDSVYNKEHPPGFRWVHDSFGSNYRMTEMQAVIGRIQLARMGNWTSIRNKYAKMIDECVADFELIRTVNVPEYIVHAEYKHYIYVNLDLLAEGWSRDRIIDELNKLDIPCYQGLCSEVYLEKAFNGKPFKPINRLKNAKLLSEICLMFLVHPTLTMAEMTYICNALNKVLTRAQRGLLVL